MRRYETVFILRPSQSEDEINAIIENTKNIILNDHGSIIDLNKWGMKKLAYPIQKKSTGFYQLFEFKAEPAFIAKLETDFRRDERVIRFMTVKLDKFAAEYSAKRKRLQKEKTEKEG